MNKVVIIGGGISGLTAAYWLQKSGHDVTILEKGGRAGGSIRTEKHKGYLIEYGPNSTLDLYQEADDLCESLGISGEKIYGNEGAKNRYVLKDGRLRPLPLGPLQFLSTDLWSIQGKLRLMCEPFIRKFAGTHEETIAEFVKRRTGQEFLDYAIDPFVTGVFAGDPYKLSLKSCFPKMYGLEHEYGGLVKGAIFGRKKKGEPKRKMRLFSFRNGLETLPEAIRKSLGNRFVGGCNVLSVKRTGEGFDIITENVSVHTQQPGLYKAGTVIFATPAWATARMIQPVSEYVAAHLMQIQYVPVVIVFTGFDRGYIKQALDGFGFLIPRKESRERGYNILGSIWSSEIFTGRAPEGKAAFTTILGGARRDDILEYSDRELIEMTLRDLRYIIGTEKKPEFVQLIRHTKAIPQYNIGHQDRIKTVQEAVRKIPGLYLAGNYINGVSVGHCIAEAAKLASHLKVT